MEAPSVKDLACHCEARKVSYRQTKEGLVVAFVIHPNEMPDALATAPLGQRYMLALAAIGDDEQPIEQSSQRQPMSQSGGIKATAERPGVETVSSQTARARASELAKERYQEASPMAQALTRSAMLVKDEQFQAWLPTVDGSLPNGEPYTEEEAARYIREHCCGGGSRASIAEGPEAYRKFLALERLFHEAIGVIPEMRS